MVFFSFTNFNSRSVKKWLYSFSLPFYLVFDEQALRYSPNIGDLVVCKYHDLYMARISFFRLHSFYGLCFSATSKALASSFRLRNSIQRFITQFSFQLYSPLLSSIEFFSFKRNSYRKSKLTFLDKQKIFYNRF